MASSTTIYHTTANVTVTIGGVSGPALFSGLTPTFAALYQVNVQVPSGIAPAAMFQLLLRPPTRQPECSLFSNPITISVQ